MLLPLPATYFEISLASLLHSSFFQQPTSLACSYSPSIKHQTPLHSFSLFPPHLLFLLQILLVAASPCCSLQRGVEEQQSAAATACSSSRRAGAACSSSSRGSTCSTSQPQQLHSLQPQLVPAAPLATVAAGAAGVAVRPNCRVPRTLVFLRAGAKPSSQLEDPHSLPKR